MNVDFSGLRTKMVDGQLRTTDVTDVAVLDAMGSVPREAFVDPARKILAYIDEDIRLGSTTPGQAPRYMMEASPFGKLLQLAEITPTDFVLDVGCGTGYSAAVLSRIASSVVALETDPSLAQRATTTLSSLGHDNVAVIEGNLADGYTPEAPYDVIILEGAVEQVPAALFAQLRQGGRLVAIEGSGHAGIARLYVKSNGDVTARRAFNAAVKPLPGFEKTHSFEF